MATEAYDGSHQRFPVPNRVKSKAANPAVLSSIISSLETDTLAPLPDNDLYAETHSRTHSRAYSSDRGSVGSSASIYRLTSSPGFGVEYGNGLELDDEEGQTDAALPPTVPTSRPPSGLSHYTATPAPRSVSRSRVSTSLRERRQGSRRSSLSAISVTSSRNKLSSESWVRQSAGAGGDEVSDSARGRPPRKGGRLRRMSSQDMLRPPSLTSPTKRAVESPIVSRAEQIIARSPSNISLSKSRLFLADVTIGDSPASAASPYPSPSPTPSPRYPPAEHSMGRPSEQAPRDDQLTPALTPPMMQKTPSPISDSIPTRTSSLRLSSSSPAGGKRKSKKSKRNSVASGKSHKPPKTIPDSKWDDLGEDDETVKRIRELREQRRSRLQESFFPPVADAVDESNGQINPVRELTTHPSDDAKRASLSRPAANRSATEPVQTHYNLSGNKEHRVPLQEPSGAHGVGAVSARDAPDALRMPKYSLDAKRPLSAQYRPTTARSEYSTIQPLSLDYSYAEAVDVLHGIAHHRPAPNDNTSQVAAAEPSPLWLKGLDLQAAPNQAPLMTPKQKYTRFRKSPSTKWTAHQPDMTLDFNKKRNRRKSMSDARNAQVLEEAQDLPRRDSIEDAVVEYLRADRLSRTIKSQSGRTIAFSEVGDPEGAAVFICVGMGLTRYVTAFYDELAATLRLRLITVDRPGVGGSEPYPSSNKSGPLGWPEDVLAICEHLGIAKFSLLAHSAGAIYALATALTCPHLIKGKVHLLAPWVPPSQLEAISHPAASAPPANPLPRSQRFLRVLPTPFLKAANASFMTATSTSLKPASKRKSDSTRTPPRRGAGAVNSPTAPTRPSSNDRPEYNRRESMMLMDQYMPSTTLTDQLPTPPNVIVENEKVEPLILSATAIPTDPSFTYASTGLNAAEHAENQRQSEYTSRLTQSTWDLATRDSNPATDLVVCLERNRDVGFRYTDVAREVVITHGSEDKRVPIANVKWLAEQMNRRALGVSLGGDNARESREAWADPSAHGGCEVRVLQGEGHGLMASPIIMSDVLTEIAGYWLGPDKGRV